LEVSCTAIEERTIDPVLRRKIVAIFADVFQVEIDANVDDISRDEIQAWDSVNHLRLVAEVEELFGIALSDEEVTTIASLNDLEKLLTDRLGICSG
jgi:acyl carrier protein